MVDGTKAKPEPGSAAVRVIFRPCMSSRKKRCTAGALRSLGSSHCSSVAVKLEVIVLCVSCVVCRVLCFLSCRSSDRTYFAECNFVDFNLRRKRVGKKYFPKVVVLHSGRPSTEKTIAQFVFLPNNDRHKPYDNNLRHDKY